MNTTIDRLGHSELTLVENMTVNWLCAIQYDCTLDDDRKPRKLGRIGTFCVLTSR